MSRPAVFAHPTMLTSPEKVCQLENETGMKCQREGALKVRMVPINEPVRIRGSVRENRMRLVSLARFRYGLLWSGSFPKIDWLRWIQACSLVALVLTAYAVVDANSRYDLASAKQAAAERKAVEAEQALAKCKNGGFAARTEGGAVYCEKALWVSL